MAIDDSELWAGMDPHEGLDDEAWDISSEDDNLNDEWIEADLDDDTGGDDDGFVWLVDFDPDAIFVIDPGWGRPAFDKPGEDGEVGQDGNDVYLCWEPGFEDGNPEEPFYEEDGALAEEPDGLASICVCFPIDAIA
jgi:hypothetical protein